MKKIILAMAVTGIVSLSFTLISTVKKSEKVKYQKTFTKTDLRSFPGQNLKGLASWD